MDLPDKMDRLCLYLSDCSPSDLTQTLGPYIGDRVRRRGVPPGGLGLAVDPGLFNLSVSVGDAHCERSKVIGLKFMIVEAFVNTHLEVEEADKLCFDITAHIPWKEVVEVTTTRFPILHSEELCIQMCNLTRLHLEMVDISTWFAEPGIREPQTFKDLLRKLDYVSIFDPTVGDGDWSHLTNFLSRRAAMGNPISLLRLGGYPHMGGDVVESIKRVVKVFEDEGSEYGGGEDSDYY